MTKRTIMSARRARRTKTVAERRVTRRALQPGEEKAATTKRKPGKSPTGASAKRAPAARREVKPALRFERVAGKIKLTPPTGYMLSVLLKLVGRNETRHNIYAWWLAVGRAGLDVLTMPFDINGADVIRCDVPDGFDFSSDAMAQGLAEFRKTDKGEQSKLIEGDPPVLHGPGGNR